MVADELTGLAHQTPELEKFLNRFYELLRYIDSGGPMAVLMIGNPVPEELEEEFCNHGANGFHVSEGRHVEYEAVMSLSDEDLR